MFRRLEQCSQSSLLTLTFIVKSISKNLLIRILKRENQLHLFRRLEQCSQSSLLTLTFDYTGADPENRERGVRTNCGESTIPRPFAQPQWKIHFFGDSGLEQFWDRAFDSPLPHPSTLQKPPLDKIQTNMVDQFVRYDIKVFQCFRKRRPLGRIEVQGTNQNKSKALNSRLKIHGNCQRNVTDHIPIGSSICDQDFPHAILVGSSYCNFLLFLVQEQKHPEYSWSKQRNSHITKIVIVVLPIVVILINNSWRENKENHYREGGLKLWSQLT